MFNQLKNLFGRFKRQPETSEKPAEAPKPQQAEPKKAAPAAKAAPAPSPAPAKAPKSAPTSAPAAAPSTPEPALSGPSVSAEETISLPLKAILSRLPASLSALVKSSGSGDVAISLKKVLSQLPQGSVKIPFGELRQGAPAGTFLDVTSQDATLVELPLPDILSRMNPALLTKRTQKTIEVPPEVGNVFGPRGETLTPGSAAAAAATAPKTAAAPVQAPAPAATPKPTLPQVPKPTAPAPATSPSIPKPAGASSPSLPKPPAPTAPAAPAPKIPFPGAAPTAAPAAAPAPATAEQTQYFLNKDTSAVGDVLTVPLANLSEAWPDAVKDDIKKNGLSDASVALPMSQLEVAMRSGKIVFPWRQLGAWLKPTPLGATANGETSVELPLKVIAPLFITQHRPVKQQKKVAVGENIPDIFSGGTAAAAAAPTAAPKPVVPAISTPNAPIAAPSLPKLPSAPAVAPAPSAIPRPPAPAMAGAAKEPGSIGEIFGDASKKSWSPNEIVQKTAALPGLSGALIATNDGLLVAGQVPSPFKAETTAAFLPQIFGRMNQYGKELMVGDLGSLTLEFNKVPWQIVKLGPIFFGVIGKSGEALPAASLKVISAELAKQK